MLDRASCQKILISIFILHCFFSVQLVIGTDISVKYQIEKISSIDTNGETISVIVVDDFAYTLDGADYNPGGLVIIDVSDPNDPVKISSLYDGGYPYELQIKDNYVIIADGADGLEIIDISDLYNPVEIYQYPVTTFCSDVEILDDLLYVANWDMGLEIFNISDIEHPIKVGGYNSNYLNCIQVAIEDDIAVVTDHRNDYTSLRVLNISNPISPQYIQQYVRTSMDFWDPEIHNKYLYVGNHAIDGGELQILNLTVPSEISYVNEFHDGGSIFSVYFNDSIAFISNYNKGVEIVDMANPLNPKKIGNYFDGGHAKKTFVQGDLIFVADREDGLEILRADITTKTANGINFIITISSLIVICNIYLILVNKRNERKRNLKN